MILFLNCCFALLPAITNSTNFDQDKRQAVPNFVWLISEDNSKHYLKIFDKHGCETPNINQLSKHGVVFERAFSNAPVCSVARTTLFTGCHAPRIGTQFHRKQIAVPLPDGVQMFPARLREFGYYTSNNSKKDYNAIEGDGVWDASNKQASWRNRKNGQPFLHVQTFHQSHEGSMHFSRKKMTSQKTKTDPKTVFISPLHPQTDLFRYTAARYRDRIRLMDEKIGQVVRQLEQDGLLDNTFVFYFSDHGGVLPGSKGYLYETGIHVPLVIRVPKNFEHLVGKNWSHSSRTNVFVSFVDFGTTVLSLAGIEAVAGTDGTAFMGGNIDFQDDINERNVAIGYADRFDEKYDMVRSIRIGPYKYIRNFQPLRFDGLQNSYRYKNLAWQQWRRLYRIGKLNSVQSQFFRKKSAEALFNLDEDPHETNNLAYNASSQNELLELRSRLTSTLKSMPDLGFHPESYLIDHAFDNPVAFGKTRQIEIESLIDVANLALEEFSIVESKLKKFLNSDNTWERYWAVQTCSAFGIDARSLKDQIQEIAASDTHPLNRVAAAEFLGTASKVNDEYLESIFESSIHQADSKVAVSMMLNSIVMLKDGYGKNIQVERNWFSRWEPINGNIKLWLDYLQPQPSR